MGSTVHYEVADGVATITLARPETLNSMNEDLMTDLWLALGNVEGDEAVRVAVLTGAGRGFCSGADLSGGDLAEGAKSPEEIGEATAQGMDEVFHRAIRALVHLAVPTIARVNGVAAGGGLGLALNCDVAIAARSAFFVSTFGPRLGIVPDMGTTWHLPLRVGRARALGIALLGDRISAAQAAEWGLIWEAVDDERLDERVAAVASLLARSSPDATARIRASIDAARGHTLDEQLEVERDHQRVLIPRNMVEGAAAFRDKREPRFGPGRTAREA